MTPAAPDDVSALIEQIRSFLADAPNGKPHEGYRYGELLSQAANALERLAAENERLVAWGGATFEAGFQERQRAERAESDLAACRAERDALRQDAMRYRWLRDQMWGQAWAHLYSLPIRWNLDGNDCAGQSMDAAIDAAIGAQEKLLEATVGSVSLRAPIDGVVKKVLRRSGENIAAGEPLIELGNGKPRRIIGFLRQPITARPQVGDVVEVRKRGSKPQVGLAKVAQVGAQLQLFTQSLRVRGFAASMERGLPVLLTVPEGLDLYPGEAVDLVPKWSR